MNVTLATYGPAENALAARLLTATDMFSCTGVGRLEVAATAPHHSHAFVIKVTAAGDIAAACENVARVLSTTEPVRRVRARAPRIYVDVDDQWFIDRVSDAVRSHPDTYGRRARDEDPRLLVVMFSNPNTNKPLHLGHLRQNVVGMALSRLFESDGWDVRRADMLGDWGIHICQAMIGYLRWGDEIGTRSSALKGDHFAGRCLVRFHAENAAQRAETVPGDPTELETAARELLLAASRGERDAVRLKRRFTRWVEAGLDETHARIGTVFDAVVRESNARQRACRRFEAGLAAGVFERRDDGSVHADLTAASLWDVTLFRQDSTSTAFVQHCGPEDELFERFNCDRLLFIYGPDWVTPHKASKELYRRLELPWQERIEGLSHGLVSLPEGRMRSRSGTVLNVDLLLDHVVAALVDSWGRRPARSCGTTPESACEQFAVALLKLAFLRVPRPLDITFDPAHLQRDVVPRLATLLAALDALAMEDDGRTSAGVAVARHANYFPTTVVRATDTADPAVLVRFTMRCAEAVLATPNLPEEVRGAVLVSLRRSLWLLNIDLPATLDGLPPVLATGRHHDESRTRSSAGTAA